MITMAIPYMWNGSWVFHTRIQIDRSYRNFIFRIKRSTADRLKFNF